MKNKKENYLFISWAASVIALFGSLYFSDIAGYEPCKLCWFQRILMYPLVVVLGISIIRKDYSIAFYTAVLSAIGGCISIYHYLTQKVPFFTDNSLSCGRVPCTSEYINWLGFITIPFLALAAFTIIFITSLFILKEDKS